jgi:hypothetical protein
MIYWEYYWSCCFPLFRLMILEPSLGWITKRYTHYVDAFPFHCDTKYAFPCISGLCGFSMCDGNVTYCCYFLFLFGSDQENDVRDDPGLIDWQGKAVLISFHLGKERRYLMHSAFVPIRLVSIFFLSCFCCLEVYSKCFGTRMLMGVAS